MEFADWIIVCAYIASIIGMSYFIGTRQKNQEDYYLGGRKMNSWKLGSSMVANQVSAISLIGAPAFIAVKEGGGLRWLQYEMAIPLAMIVIIIMLVPLLRSTGGITIYEYLENRFGYPTRLAMSALFLVSRSMATGVALLATSYLASVCVGMDLALTIIIIGAVSMIYTSLGGIAADIYSDILQLAVLWISSFVVIGILLHGSGMPSAGELSADGRFRIFDFTATGLGDGSSFSFWPMLVGGLFLYISYYGCDQSQAQRLLAARDDRTAMKSLVINGMLRFPLVLTYCFVGILMIPFLAGNPDFAEHIKGLSPDYLMPYFFRDYVPAGLLGLIVAGVFAASMSSLDSAINSLSAATWQDIIIRLKPSMNEMNDRRKVYWSRGITVLWGIFSISCALYMAGGAETVIELVNKIGSAFYGPVAGVFILGFLSVRAGQAAALAGLICGFTGNILLWLFFQETVSWMWWNCSGFFLTLFSGYAVSFIGGSRKEALMYTRRRDEAQWDQSSNTAGYIALLAVWFIAIISCCIYLERFFL